MNDLPAKYAALVAKRPDLDIPGLEHIEDELWTYDVVSVEVEVSEAPEDAWKQEGPQWADGAAAIPTRVAGGRSADRARHRHDTPGPGQGEEGRDDARGAERKQRARERRPGLAAPEPTATR